MKKILIIGAITVVLVAVLGVAGYAYAQTNTPPTPVCAFNGQCTGNGGTRGPGMMGNYGSGDTGLLHDYMLNALAEVFGLTPEEILAYHQDGKTMYDLVADQDLTVEEFRTKMLEARTAAIEQAVADGVITQEQADWMLNRTTKMQSNGFGSRGMHGGSYGSQGGGPGFRNQNWNRQP